MNQVDKELLISKRFMNEEEQVNIEQIELAAMMEATIFAGAIMESSMDGTCSCRLCEKTWWKKKQITTV